MNAMIEQLYDDDVGDLPPFDPQGAELLDVRRRLVRLRQLEREAAQLANLRKAVVAEYERRELELQQQAQALRGDLQAALERGPFGTKLQFPDAGAIHLTTVPARLQLASQEEAVSTYGFRFLKPQQTDVPAMNKWAAEHFKATGEVPAGYEPVAAHKTLVVKSA